jgi:peptide/nickel transport system substrate-binding protein
MVFSVSPAKSSAVKNNVVIVTSNQLTGLNPSVENMNLTFNSEVAYLRSFGFDYYDDSPKLIQNTIFGSYRIVSQRPFRVQYTVNDGKVWSDGTPITAVDLLLSHVICSSSFSVSAGLGNPQDAATKPSFASTCYGGSYDVQHVGTPIVSTNKMSLTIEYSKQFPDWQLFAPSPFPTHALVLLAEGQTGIQESPINLEAKNRFERAFLGRESGLLSRMARVWSNSYNINRVDNSTNPLLLIGNGGYQIKSAIPGVSVTLIANPLHKSNPSGPALNGIETIEFRVIGDGTAAAQALRIQEVDIYQGQPTADSFNLLSSIPSVKVVGGNQAVYEHLDMRVDTAYGSNTPYTGPWQGMTSRAVDLRTAFFMAFPRDEIVERLIKPINPSARRMDSLLLFPGEPGYEDLVRQNGVSRFTQGSQSSREAAALALVRKYYPNASPTNPGVTIRLLWGTPSNARRAATAQIATSALSRAGFKLEASGLSNWSSQLSSSEYDAMFFAWVKSSVTQDGNADLFCTQCGNNYLGYSNRRVDDAVYRLTNDYLVETDKLREYLTIEQQIYADAVSIPIYQHPGLTAVNSSLLNFKPSPLSPQILWNYWEWSFPGLTTTLPSNPMSSGTSSSSSTTQNSTDTSVSVPQPQLPKSDQSILNWNLPLSVKVKFPTSLSMTILSSSGLKVNTISRSESICRINGGELVVLSSGSCIIAANQPGDDRFNPTPERIFVLSVDSLLSTSAVKKVKTGGSITCAKGKQRIEVQGKNPKCPKGYSRV